jgi:Flp pilus assembly protein TadD
MAWLGLGGADMMISDFVKAEEEIIKAITLKPNDPSAYGNLVLLYIKMEDWDKAQEAVMKLEEVDPQAQGLAEKKLMIQRSLAK